MIRVFTSKNCPSCKQIVKVLKQHNVPFEEVYIDEQPEAKVYLVRRFGVSSVPAIETDSKIYVGYHPKLINKIIRSVN